MEIVFEGLNVNKEEVLKSIEKDGLSNTAKKYGYDTEDYDNLLLGGRLIMWDLCQKVSPSIEVYTNRMSKRLNTQLIQFLISNKEVLEEELINSTKVNYGFDFFSASTLVEMYLSKSSRLDEFPVETPQLFFLRIASSMYGQKSISEVIRCYRELCSGYYIHATPTLFNAGMRKSQQSSCFLMSIPDSLEGIFDVLKNAALISKEKGGLGIDVSRIRHSDIGEIGMSQGIIPMLKMYNDMVRYVDQLGLRKGAATVYLRPHHIDIYEFTSMTDKIGDHNERVYDLNTAIWFPWLFWKRVKSNEDWTLFCPAKAPELNDVYGLEFERLYVEAEQRANSILQLKESDPRRIGYKRVKARDLLTHIIRTQRKSGMPYVLHADACNLKSNQRHLGYIRCANLCVSFDTRILTDEGEVLIGAYEGKTVNVWNGESFSSVEVKKTGKHQTLYRITFDIEEQFKNGDLNVISYTQNILHCTPYHKFLTQSTGLSIKENPRCTALDLKIGDILQSYKLPNGTIRRPKVKMIEELSGTHDTFCFTEHINNAGLFNGVLTGQCLEVVEFISDDEIASCNLASICVSSMAIEPYSNSQNMVQAYDFQKLSNIARSVTRNLNRVIDTNWYPLDKISKMGNIKPGPIRNSNLKHRPLGIGVSGFAEALYILDLPFESSETSHFNKLFFGCLYFNCLVESVQLSIMETPHTSFPCSPFSQGKLQFDLWREEFKIKGANSLREEKDDDPIDPSEWGQKEVTLYIPCGEIVDIIAPTWDDLKRVIKKYGTRNSLLTSLMPTASSSIITMTTETTEPPQSNVYSRKVLAGSYPVLNHHFVLDLKREGVWTKQVFQHIIENSGSIRNLQEFLKENGIEHNSERILHLSKKYKTTWEISQKALLRLASDRGRYIDQSQSTNIYIADPSDSELIVLHTSTDMLGLKTGMYYLRQKGAVEPIKFTLSSSLSSSLVSRKNEKEIKQGKEDKENNERKVSIECNEEVCLMCHS